MVAIIAATWARTQLLDGPKSAGSLWPRTGSGWVRGRRTRDGLLADFGNSRSKPWQPITQHGMLAALLRPGQPPWRVAEHSRG